MHQRVAALRRLLVVLAAGHLALRGRHGEAMHRATEADELPVDVRVDSAIDVAGIFTAQRDLNMEAALLVTVPVPDEFEVDADQLNRVLEDALDQAQHEGISGRDVTPFLLSQMASSSKGTTLRANIALLENNARVAAEIAIAVSAML